MRAVYTCTKRDVLACADLHTGRTSVAQLTKVMPVVFHTRLDWYAYCAHEVAGIVVAHFPCIAGELTLVPSQCCLIPLVNQALKPVL